MAQNRIAGYSKECLLQHDARNEIELHCNNCKEKVCEECSSVIIKLDAYIRLCEICYRIDKDPTYEGISELLSQIKREIERQKPILEQKKTELSSVKKEVKAEKLQYSEFETHANKKRAKNEKIFKFTVELGKETKYLEAELEKCTKKLAESTVKSSLVNGDIDRIKEQHEDYIKKMQEFEEMIKEQDEENQKLRKDVETARVDFENQKKDVEIMQMGEAQLMKRIKKLKKNIEKVRRETNTLEQHLKLLVEEKKLKSDTASVISERFSLISSSHFDQKQEKTNELSTQVSSRIEEIKSLYKEISLLKQKEKNSKQDVASKNCKCIIQ